MWRAMVACVVLVCVLAATPGCERLHEGGSTLAEKTEPGREQVSKDTQELVKTLQKRVDELQGEVKELKAKVAGETQQQ